MSRDLGDIITERQDILEKEVEATKNDNTRLGMWRLNVATTQLALLESIWDEYQEGQEQ
jgi:hypothetical protein